MDKHEGFEVVARPLVEWLNKNGNPHMTILVDTTGAELLSGEKAFHTTEYVKG